MGRSILFVFVILFGYIKLVTHNNLASGNTPVNKPQVTTIYLVRHAEKVTTDPTSKDPALTTEGEKRAQDLKGFMKGVKLDAIFSTAYKRTQATVAPLVGGNIVQVYEAQDFEALKAKINKEFAGKTILVVGHSNTLLPMIEAFGAKKPFDAIADNEYDNIFILKVPVKGPATVQAKKYGKPATS